MRYWSETRTEGEGIEDYVYGCKKMSRILRYQESTTEKKDKRQKTMRNMWNDINGKKGWALLEILNAKKNKQKIMVTELKILF